MSGEFLDAISFSFFFDRRGAGADAVHLHVFVRSKYTAIRIVALRSVNRRATLSLLSDYQIFLSILTRRYLS
jgi:hypothetical protein